jgi:hypothetical protein
MQDYLDEKIKSKFKLFTGVRSYEEDQKIYDKVWELCFDELTGFIEDNLNESEQKKMLEEIKGREEDKAQEVLLTYLSQIDNYRFKLDKRLDYFLTNLLYSAVKNK